MPAPANVSVLLLARDETRDLEMLLPTLTFAREVVVVWDPRGDRATRDAAERLGARVFEHEFAGFGAQRRFALAQCTCDWVLWIDADERIDAREAANLFAALTWPPRESAMTLRRQTAFLGKPIRYCGWQDERIVRLFRRDAWQFDDALVHETLVPAPGAEGTVGRLRVTLRHESYATWARCVDKLHRYAAANAEKAYRAGRRAALLDVVVRPPLRFLRQYVLQLGFLDGAHGFLLCALASAQVFLKYADLWSRSRPGADGR